MTGPIHGQARRRPTTAQVVSLILLAGLALGAALVVHRVSTPDPSLVAAVRAAIVTDMTILELPPGESPGHLAPGTAAVLRARLAEVLPTVYTGTLLTVKAQALARTLDAMGADDRLSWTTAGGIAEFTVTGWGVSGTHATVAGSDAVWVTGCHRTGAVFVDDRSEGRYAFEAGLDRIGGRWLVSSWTDRQLD